ncbi:hypothetical protein [Luteolibacter ambystomatis]|uniref:hypothetical protein n=1 Tax=Luteolibacter ambystomatis TaxID=2824561 RepID=UPI001CF7CC67|nr:hypothetical protein [Luteolibacter ambystomatis]
MSDVRAKVHATGVIDTDVLETGFKPDEIRGHESQYDHTGISQETDGYQFLVGDPGALAMS